ncbi:MAG TPA: hypothetical protein VGM78_04895, partial [Ilumatobacteraceae bacterium]
DVPPSDDPNRDAIALSQNIESLSAAMHQWFVPQFSVPAYRGAVAQQSHLAARRAAAMALFINKDNLLAPGTVQVANIGGDTTTTAAPATTTTVQNIAQQPGAPTTLPPPIIANPAEYYAIPSQFGILSAVQLPVGRPSSGAQVVINMETPSLNSYIYTYQTC